MLAQPLFLLCVVGAVVLLTVLTAPLWMRVLVKLGNAMEHQLKDAGGVVDKAINPSDDKPEGGK